MRLILKILQYIFILNLTPGFNALGKDSLNTIGETFKGYGTAYIRGLTVPSNERAAFTDRD